MPVGVFRGHQEEYWKDSPGCKVGCLPTTPGPCTSRVRSNASVMIQCRVSNCTACNPRFVMRTVYSNTHSPGPEFSAEYRDITSTLMSRVIASDTEASANGSVGILNRHRSNRNRWAMF